MYRDFQGGNTFSEPET